MKTSCITSLSGEKPDDFVALSTDFISFGGKNDLSVTESVDFPTNFDCFGGKKLRVACGAIGRERVTVLKKKIEEGLPSVWQLRKCRRKEREKSSEFLCFYKQRKETQRTLRSVY